MKQQRLYAWIWTLAHKVLRWVFKRFYRADVCHMDHLPQNKAAVLVSNHVSFIDGFVLSLMLDRPIRFLVFKTYYYFPLFYPIMRFCGAIPIASGRTHREAAIRAARDALSKGDWICIFAEGMLTRTGHLQVFRPGFEKIAEGLHVPIVPIHLEGLWRSNWALRGEKLFGNRQWFRKGHVVISVGKPLPAHTKAKPLREAIQALASQAKWRDAKLQNWQLETAMRSVVRRAFWKTACSDPTTQYTYWQLWRSAWQAAHWLNTHLPVSEYPRLGLLFPPSVAHVQWIWACTLLQRPFTVCHPDLAQPLQDIAQQSHIDAFVGSWEHIDSYGWDTNHVTLHTPEVSTGAWWTALFALCRTTTPHELHHPHVALHQPTVQLHPQRSVVLSYLNLYAAITGLDQVLQWRASCTVLGSVPMADAWGYTITLWLPLLRGMHVVYSPPDETDAFKQLITQHKPEVLLDTEAAYRSHIRHLRPQHLACVQWALVSSLHLPDNLIDCFREHFGFDLWSGFGFNETSGAVSLNRPHVRIAEQLQRGNRPGSVGITLPGIMVQVIDPHTHKVCPPNEWGHVCIKGPWVASLLGDEPHSSQDAWFHLQVWGHLDKEGFLFIGDPDK